MQEHYEVTNYIAKTTQRLKADGFRITENVTDKNHVFRCVAKRTRFQLEHYGFAEFFFIFAKFPMIDKLSLKEFSTDCFKYARKHRSIPLPCGLFESVICFPVALVNSVDDVTCESVRNEEPAKHWASTEMPVLCDLSSKQLCYFEKTPRWGSLYWDYFRAMIVTMLSP